MKRSQITILVMITLLFISPFISGCIAGERGRLGPMGPNGTPGATGPGGGIMNQTPNMTANMTAGPQGIPGLDNMTANMTIGPVGPAGGVGPAGAPGAAATVDVNATFTGLPGTAANVTNVGTSSTALLDFIIPEGYNGTLDDSIYYWVNATRPLTGEKIRRDVDNDLLTIYGSNAIAGGTGGILSLFGVNTVNPNSVEIAVGDGAVGNTLVTSWKGGATPMMDMNGYNITGIRTIVNQTDAVNKSWTENLVWNNASLSYAINESYAYLPGRPNGQVLTGGTNSGDALTLNASANAGGNIVMRLGDNNGGTNISIRNYTNEQVAYIDSLGNMRMNRSLIMNDGIITGGINANENLTLNATTNNGGLVKIQPVSGYTTIGETNTTHTLSTPLKVTGTTISEIMIDVYRSGGSSVYGLAMRGARTAPNNPTSLRVGDYVGGILFNSYNGVSYSSTGSIALIDTGNGRGGDMVFGTAPTGSSGVSDRLIIRNNGNVTIGSKLINSSLFNVVGTGATFVRFSGYGAGTATFDSGGNITSVSDEKYKTNVRPYTNGLSKILQLNPVTYNWNPASGLATGDLNIGLIANEVKNVMPEIVSSKKDVTYEQVLVKPEIKDEKSGEVTSEAEYTTVEKPILDKDGKQTETLSYSQQGVIDALINSVKELNAKIEAQNQTINKQEARIAALEKKVGIVKP